MANEVALSFSPSQSIDSSLNHIMADDALVTALELWVSRGYDDHLLPGGRYARLPFKDCIKKFGRGQDLNRTIRNERSNPRALELRSHGGNQRWAGAASVRLLPAGPPPAARRPPTPVDFVSMTDQFC
ncbi:hypothetical protein EVAR_33927_1 [Eumeta japonica]|uniref:Uncharacterized protein n=1 Tax=Eumeta variegata TaxID=151549 RepID=A0A4C1VYS8_EUMVA|nr:hypothetical protein EVAR_33927_1 [Eumeta japonica]